MHDTELNDAPKAAGSNEVPATSDATGVEAKAGPTKSSISFQIACVGALMVAFGAICFVAFSKRFKLDDHLENTLARFTWDARDFLFVSALLVGSISLVLARGKKTQLIQHILILLLFGAMFALGVAAKSPHRPGQGDAYLVCAASLIGIELLALILRFVPQIVGGAFVLIGLTFPLGLVGLMQFDLFWRHHVVTRIIIGLVIAAVGTALLVRKNEKAQQAIKNRLSVFADATMRRKMISVPALAALVLLIVWFAALRSMFAPVPVDGKWQGKGEGQLVSIEFTVEDNGRFATNVFVAFGPSGQTAWSINGFPGRYEIKHGEFTVVQQSSDVKGEIHAVFKSATEASGYVDIEERISETTYDRVGPRGVMVPSFYSGVSRREGNWTARVEPAGAR
jgi:hypothetical protein